MGILQSLWMDSYEVGYLAKSFPDGLQGLLHLAAFDQPIHLIAGKIVGLR